MVQTSHTTRLQSAAPPHCGMQVGELVGGRFRLDAVVGWGGQAVVFQATDIQQRGLLAIKAAREDLAATSRQEALDVLRWEAHLLRRLQHPALPVLRGFEARTNAAWLARDLIEGRSLAEYAGHAALDPRIVQGWALQLCDLLRYLHTRSPAVICGDLKPANLVARPDGRLALIDLGAAHTRTRRPPRKPRPRHGTPGYAPPEQMGGRELDERSDLFSLAVLCYELLTGEDPAAAPLQFNLARLGQVAPLLAPGLRLALTLDQAQRVPTAATLRALLAPPLPPSALSLGYGVSLVSRRDLLDISVRHPRLLENVLASGDLERWLTDHPAREMGNLLHTLRTARRSAPSRQPALETLLTAMAPSEGSPLLQVLPTRLDLGTIPLRRRRIWSWPAQLTIINSAPQPLRWDLECPNHPGADLRLLEGERRVRRRAGVLAPGARTQILVVATGKAGALQGTLELRCGNHNTAIPWVATAAVGAPVGRQFVRHLDDLDLNRTDLVEGLEALLHSGALTHWLRDQGERPLAGELETALATKPCPTEVRLLLARLLHRRDPARFPLLRIHGYQAPGLRVVAGAIHDYTLEVENCGTQPCTCYWRSNTGWATVNGRLQSLAPGTRMPAVISLAPPGNLTAGLQSVTLTLHAGTLVVPVESQVEVVVERWWRKVLRWMTG